MVLITMITRKQARSQVLRFGRGNYIVRGYIFLFFYYNIRLKQIFLGTTKFEDHCLRMPTVATGLHVGRNGSPMPTLLV